MTKPYSEEIAALAAKAAGITIAALDQLAADLIGSNRTFAGLLAARENERPTMRVDVDPRYANLAVAFNAGAQAMGKSLRAWTPGYSACDLAAVAKRGLQAV